MAQSYLLIPLSMCLAAGFVPLLNSDCYQWGFEAMFADYSSVARRIFYSKDLLLERSVARTVVKSSYSKKRAQLHEGSLTRKWRKVFLVLELKYQRYQNFILKFARAKNSAFAIRNYRSKQEDYQYHSKNI